MRVAYVTMRFPEPSETFATNEVRILAEAGATITVHGLRRRHADADRLTRERGLASVRTTHNGVRASLRGTWAALTRPVLLLRTLAWLIRSTGDRARDLAISLVLLPRSFDILRRLEVDRPDVVHMYWGHFPTMVGYLVQNRLPGVVTSVSIVAYDLRREYGGAVRVARRADVVRTHADVNRDHISRFTGLPVEAIHVIYNGVDLPWLATAARGHAKVPHRIVTVARLIESKGTDDVLRAFAAIHERWPDATLVVVGDGPDLPRLRTLANDLGLGAEVRFAGFLPHDKTVEEIAQADVFMLLSRMRDERLPNVVKEGMGCSCICVTTPTPGIDELVQDGDSGFVVPMSDPDAAFEAVDRVFSGDVDMEIMAAAALAHVRRDFDVRRTAPTYETLWRAAMERRNALPAEPHDRGSAR